MLAHHLEYTLATVEFSRDQVEVSLQFHVAALVLEEEPGLLSEPVRQRVAKMRDDELLERINRASDRLRKSVRFEIDGTPWQELDFIFPLVDQIRRDALATEPMPSPRVLVRGPLAASARTFTAEFPSRLGKVMLNLQSNGVPDNIQVLRPGEKSWPYLVREQIGDGVAAIPNWARIGAAYLILGFEHIVPKGLDHILFVVGLFLLRQSWRSLLIQVTAFTIAHSLTLALSIFNLVSLPSIWVESIIALSIAGIAIENLLSDQPGRWRPAIVFSFGLIHGLGFAAALRSFGTLGEQPWLALLSFNVGVELGQLAVIAMAFAAVGWFRDRSWYRPLIVIPASTVIAFVGVFWSVQRLLA